MNTWMPFVFEYSHDLQNSIDIDQYNEFCKLYKTWYQISGMRMGEAFCHHFNIKDEILKSFSDDVYSAHRIKYNWIKIDETKVS